MEFEVGDCVSQSIPSLKGVRHFGKKGKLAPRYVGPFVITERVDKVSYRLELPQHMSGIHPVFHVSMLRKHMKDDNRVVVPEILGVNVRPDISYEVEPIRILARSERKLCTKVQKMMKILWNAMDESDATWELEKNVRKDFPHLFEDEVDCVSL